MLPCYSYRRFSHPNQATGDSIRRQTANARKWVEANPGYYLDETLVDRGLSARTGAHLKRGSLGAFLKLVEAGRIPRGAVLYCESLDRISRQNPIKEALPVFQSILKAGVKIATAKRLFDWDTMEVWDLMEALIEMKRAAEESETKSMRGKEVQAQKRANIHTRKITPTCPGWLRLNNDRTKFVEIPERVKTVKNIFRLAIEGFGAQQICSRFNSRRVPVISHKKTARCWSKSYILKILTSKAVLGHFTPHMGHSGPDRRPIGDTITDYYPQIICDADFEQAQQALRSRKVVTGPQSTRVSSLVTGLCRDARDKNTMVVVAKSKQKGGYGIVSGAAQRGEKNTKYISFPYPLFERALLTHLRELKIEDITGKRPELDTLGVALLASQAHLRKKQKLITELSAALDDNADSKAIIDKLLSVEQEAKEIEQAIDETKLAMRRAQSDALHNTHEILELLDDANGEELYDLRVRLKQQLRNLISEIWVLIEASKSGRYLLADIHYALGGIRTISVSQQSKRGGQDFDWGSERREEGLDLKNYTV